jgi:hypothetical protein
VTGPTDRTPPNDEQAERALLGYVLNLGQIPERVNGLPPSDFYRPVHETIWAAMRSLTDQQKPTDVPAVSVHLKAQGQLNTHAGITDVYLFDLQQAPPIADPAYTAETIRDQARRRRAIEAYQRGLQRAQDPATDLEEVLRHTEEELGRIPGGQSADAILQRPGVYTRDQLDQRPPREDAIEGFLPRCGLVLVAAWRGSGKSFLALAIAGAISTRQPTFWGRKVKTSGPVIYVCHEGEDGIQERVRAWEKVNGVRADRILWWTAPMDITDDQMRADLGLVARHLGAVAIILDPARTTGFKSEDTKDGAAYALALGLLKRSFDGVVVVLHNSGYDRTRERGSTTLGDACDQVFNIIKKPGGVRLVLPGRLRDDPDEEEPLMVYMIESVPETRSAVLVPAELELAAAIDSLRDRIFKLIEADPGMTTKAIAELLDQDPSNTSAHLKALVHEGKVENRGNRAKSSWYPCDPSQALA